MKKVLVVIFLTATFLSAQTKDVTLKDSTLFKQYNQRLTLLANAFNSRVFEIAKKDSTCREIQMAINEVRYWMNEEIKKQGIKK